METKLIALITLDLLGATWIVKSLIERIDSVKEGILFIVVLIYAMCRFYIRVRRDHVLLRKEMLEQLERERAFNKLVSENKRE